MLMQLHFTGLREIVPKALESVSPNLVYKYWAQSKSILNAYYAGAVYGDEQFREHFIGVIARSRVRQRVLPVGLQYLEI